MNFRRLKEMKKNKGQVTVGLPQLEYWPGAAFETRALLRELPAPSSKMEHAFGLLPIHEFQNGTGWGPFRSGVDHVSV